MQQKFQTYATTCVMEKIPLNMNQPVNVNVL